MAATDGPDAAQDTDHNGSQHDPGSLLSLRSLVILLVSAIVAVLAGVSAVSSPASGRPQWQARSPEWPRG